MVRLDDLLIDVRNEIQRGIDAIEADIDAEEHSGPTVEISDIEIEFPFGVEEQTRDGTDDDTDDAVQPSDLEVRPGATGGSFSLRLTPTRRRKRPAADSDPGTGRPGVRPRGEFPGEGVRTEHPGEARGEGPASIPDVEHPELLDPQDTDDPNPGDSTALESYREADPAQVPGVGETYAEKLREADISTIAALADASRKEVAETLDTGTRRAARFVRCAELMELGARPTTAHLLVSAGFDAEPLATTPVETVLERVRNSTTNIRLPDEYELDDAEVRTLWSRAREAGTQ